MTTIKNKTHTGDSKTQPAMQITDCCEWSESLIEDNIFINQETRAHSTERIIFAKTVLIVFAVNKAVISNGMEHGTR